MIPEFSKFLIRSLLVVLIVSTNCIAQEKFEQLHADVVMRKIGHQLLLKSQDSTSRVLPIQKDSNQYRIAFDHEVSLNPDHIIGVVKEQISNYKIAKNYFVETMDCATNEMAHNFEVNERIEGDIMTCGGRVLPPSCYEIIITIMEHDDELSTLFSTTTDQKFDQINKTGKFSWGLSILALAILSFLVFYFWKRNNEVKIDPNLISIGKYKFDKTNAELILERQVIELTSKESDLLLLLYNNVNSTVKREDILRNVWGDDGDYVGRTLDVFISKLRKKLELDTAVKIMNARGVGYKLIMSVR